MNDECTPVLNTGLRGVDVASSKICDVQGKKGKLIYRGYRIEDLAENTTFEEVCYLLLHERLPERQTLATFDDRLKHKRRIPDSVVTLLKHLPKSMDPMDVLQAATPLLVQADEKAGTENREDVVNSAEYLIAGLSSLIAAWDRIRNDKSPVTPDTSLGHAAACRTFIQCIHVYRPSGSVHQSPHLCRHHRSHRQPVRPAARRRQCPGHENAHEDRFG